MNRERIRLEVQPVDSDYAPRYPRSLSPAEYRQLLERDTRARTRHVAALAAGFALASGMAREGEAQDGTKPKVEREAAVLNLLRRISDDGKGWTGYWYPGSSFEVAEGGEAPGTHPVVPHIPISYGNSHNGLFDAGRARQLAVDMFQVYGLSPEVDHVIEGPGVQATLDGWDPEARVGFELRGDTSVARGMFASARPEAPQVGLEDEEVAAERGRGARIQVSEANAYPLMDGDQLTPMIAYLAGIVDFLNAVTDGPDVDLSGLIFEGGAVLPIADGAERRMQLSEPDTLRFELPGLDADSVAERRPKTPTVIAFRHFYGGTESDEEKAPVMRGRLIQDRGDGKPPLVVEGRPPRWFAPGGFDPARPFSLELELGPGTYHLGGDLRVGIALR